MILEAEQWVNNNFEKQIINEDIYASKNGIIESHIIFAKHQQEQSYSEKQMLEMVHKFGFDYTYNYRGNKTLYEYVDEWFEEYKRLNKK